jgi:hypothetical protein
MDQKRELSRQRRPLEEASAVHTSRVPSRVIHSTLVVHVSALSLLLDGGRNQACRSIRMAMSLPLPAARQATRDALLALRKITDADCTSTDVQTTPVPPHSLLACTRPIVALAQ